jgi:exonuclease III
MDLSKVLIWNVRGLNRKARRDVVRDMVGSTRSNIVCLQETKKAAISRRMVMSMLGAEFVVLPADGTRGGVLLAWKGSTCQGLNTRIDTFSLSRSSLLMREVLHGGLLEYMALKRTCRNYNSCRSCVL